MNDRQDSPSTLPAGATVYTKSSLRFYDFLVHSVSNRLIWRCPAGILIAHSQEHLSSNHLEIGIGTGKLFRKIGRGREFERLVIADVNADCLDAASKNLRSHSPQVWPLNLLELETADAKFSGFQSIGLNYVLHCLPLTIVEKVDLVCDLMSRYWDPGGVLFGSTIMPDLNPNWLSKRLMRFYNRKTIFNTQNDSRKEFEELFSKEKWKISTATKGCVCLFEITTA